MSLDERETIKQLLQEGKSIKEIVNTLLSGQELTEEERRKKEASLRVKIWRIKKESEPKEEEPSPVAEEISQEPIEIEGEKPAVSEVGKETIIALWKGIGKTLSMLIPTFSRGKFEFVDLKDDELEMLAETWQPIINDLLSKAGGNEYWIVISMTAMVLMGHIKPRIEEVV